MKKTKVFISHSSKDIKQVSLLVDLLADMGLTNDDLFCSSVPDYSIPLNADIYDYLSSLFHEHDKWRTSMSILLKCPSWICFKMKGISI